MALFSGNYNYVRDGANQALNRLVAYLLRQGVQVRVYSPTVEEPAFEPTGDLVDVPAIPIPGRSEYRLPIALPARVRRDLKEFAPNVVHVSSPDLVGHRAVSWARRHKVAAVASVHTRFDTYLAYYHLQALEPLARGIMRRFYHRCEMVMAPAEIHRRNSARATHEPGHHDLDARHRSRSVQSRAAGHGMAPQCWHRRR